MLALIDGTAGLIVLAVIALLFGSSQIPKLAKSLGSAQAQFKKGVAEAESPTEENNTPQ